MSYASALLLTGVLAVWVTWLEYRYGRRIVAGDNISEYLTRLVVLAFLLFTGGILAMMSPSGVPYGGPLETTVTKLGGAAVFLAVASAVATSVLWSARGSRSTLYVEPYRLEPREPTGPRVD